MDAWTGGAENGDRRASSSDDSENSEAEDARLVAIVEDDGQMNQRPPRQTRRRWDPAAQRYPLVEDNGPRAVLDEIRRREHFVEQYIGDDGDGSHPSDIRMATSNINGGIWRKMDEKIKTWFIANRLDFFLISDVGLERQVERTVWARSTTGGRAPGLLLVGNRRAAVLLDAERWAGRWRKESTKMSPSGRSISLTFRLGGRTELVVVATYCVDTPARNVVETKAERDWISRVVMDAQMARHVVVVGGDFNCYTDEQLDRDGPPRSVAAQRESRVFEGWLTQNQMMSSFRHLYPACRRFTYENGGVRSTLDDIYISTRHASAVRQSGVWLRSLNQSDHIGTPFAALQVTPQEQVHQQDLRGAKAIKVLNAKNKSTDDLEEFRLLLDDHLRQGIARTGNGTLSPGCDEARIQQWLDTSIQQLQTSMYHAARVLWGEKSQTRQRIDRAVSQKRTIRCTGQLKVARAAWLLPSATGADIAEMLQRIQWPKWIVYPDRTPSESAHAAGARAVDAWRKSGCPALRVDAVQWAEEGWKLWRAVVRTRRDWRSRQRQAARLNKRENWMASGNIRQLLRNTFGAPLPPVQLRGAMVEGENGIEYRESKAAVTAAMTSLLDSWVPAEERTQEPRHLETMAEEDEHALPEFVKQWILPDVKEGGLRRAAFDDPASGWSALKYSEERQKEVDKVVRKGVSPGHGGIPQELWVAAPEWVRRREREIFSVILETGVTPRLFGYKQLIFLPKTSGASNVWSGVGLPPWRPIMVQSSLATRFFTLLSRFLEDRAGNHPLQHGFQRDRTVQDASLATTLLMERAVRKKEKLYLLSKDCEKCYDRVPRWVMSYIYKRLGAPEGLIKIIGALLSAGPILVRSDYGWIDSGVREFGLGQGSVLSIRHIGYYMDLLIERQERGPGAIAIQHHQRHQAPSITTVVLVDDVVDVAATREGIEHRAHTSNMFTGVKGTGGVFGAAKSFLIAYQPRRRYYEDPVVLSDGRGRPQPVRTLSPTESFKHLGIEQSVTDGWDKTLAPLWARLKADAERVVQARPDLRQLQYIVNRVWVPRLVYRTQLSSALKQAAHVDKLIRRVARRVLRLPYSLPAQVYHDKEHGVGLARVEDICRSSRLTLALKVLNTPTVPAHHLLVEALEDYQALSGLTDHPLRYLLTPPSHLQGWAVDTIRVAVAMGARTDLEWINPPHGISGRPNDRPLWDDLPSEVAERLLRLNVCNTTKLRFVGDVANTEGTRLLSGNKLALRYGWRRKMCRAYNKLEPDLKRILCAAESDSLVRPVGRTVLRTAHLQLQAVGIGPGEFFVAAEFAEVDGTIELRGHEIGQRMGDQVWNNESDLGWEIDVQWWHERPQGSGVWRPRPNGLGREFAAVCVPVLATPVGPRSDPWRCILVWDDTSRADKTGRTNREAIDTAFQRSRRRYEDLMASGSVTTIDRVCSACGRRSHSVLCGICGLWHHAACIPCGAPPLPTARHQWAPLGALPGDGEEVAAGDGSVLHSGTPEASGAWATINRSGRWVGRVDVHWRNITSTRCECYALLAGLVQSGDRGTQVCDNQAAIRILGLARDIATGKRPPHIKFSSVHRVEIRSMVNAMQTDGSFQGTWVRSHQEHEATADAYLRAQRLALAQADTLASTGHERVEFGRHVAIEWDWAQLVDERGHPVVGRTELFLQQHAVEVRQESWVRRQRNGPPWKQTATLKPCDMARLLSWSDVQRRFVWRAIGNALHTNAQKHRLVPEWSPLCRVCTHAAEDTQAHRFGASVPQCSTVSTLAADTVSGIYSVAYDVWVPDQDTYIPQWGHELAASSTCATRPWWATPDDKSFLWKPMVGVADDLWVHGVQLHLLCADAGDITLASRLFRKERECIQPSTVLLPNRILWAVRQCEERVASYVFHPSQASGVFDQGCLSDLYRCPSTLLSVVAPPSGHAYWWIDDVFFPRAAAWWAATLSKFTCIPHQQKAMWVACFDDTAGHRALKHFQVEWILNIPASELRMRTAAAVSHQRPTPRTAITARNDRTIWIGVLAPTPTPHDEHHRRQQIWIDTLQHDYKQEWLCNDPTQVPDRSVNAFGILTWTPASANVLADNVSVASDWIHQRFPQIYEAPAGWRAWPVGNAETSRWCAALATSRREARRLHKAILTAIWDANFEHWRRTCDANAVAIEAGGESEDMETANAKIVAGRRQHQHFRFALDTKILRRSERRSDRSHAWQATHQATQERSIRLTAVAPDNP